MNTDVLKKNTSIMREEILSQPALLKQSYKMNREKIAEIAGLIKHYDPALFYFAARGSSEHACLLAQYILEIYEGLPGKLINPSVITLYKSNLCLGKSVLIGVSQSGGAEDVARVLDHGREKGSFTVAITNIQGAVDKAAEHRLSNNIGKETALPATKSYMSQAYLLLALIAYVNGNPKLMEALEKIPDAIEAGIELEEQILECAHYFRCHDNIDIIARGMSYAAAAEAELKIQETSNVNARAYAASDYAHGPFSLTNSSRSYIFTLVEKATDSFTLAMHEQMAQKQIFSLAITNKPEIGKKFPLSLVLPGWCEGIEGIFASLAVFQLFASYLALYRGKNPDAPEGVSKTVVTI